MTLSLKAAALLAALVLVGSAGSAVASAQTPCADFGGTIDGTTCRVHTTTAAYTLEMTFPTDYADEAPMVDYLTQTRDGFVNVSQMPGSTGLPYALDITSEQYRSGRAPGGTQSTVLKIFQNVGGAHPLWWYKAFNYDLGAKQAITFDTLFAPGSQPLPVILPIVQRDVESQLGSSVTISDGLNPSHYQNFALTDTDLIFFFDQGDMLPLAAGAISAKVPRTAVASMLRQAPSA
jgi:hypothetical protein